MKYDRALHILGLALAFLLLLTPVRAEEGGELRISTTDQLLAFAEACRTDSYSAGLTVYLDADLDLTGLNWMGIPIFCGEFDGGGHSIMGLSVTGDGSRRGLFRTLTETAWVHDLTVQGTVAPAGSRSQTGGIAGINAGRITGCVFDGSVTGAEAVGGIAGRNEVAGLLENCRMSGIVGGGHFVGGITGENAGVVRGCTNTAAVNTTEQENRISLSDITLDTLTGSESARTVTDVGGIAGLSTGVIRSCENQGDVGYRQMGYNIGGIAGSQRGYLEGCVNRGTVQGRKEEGGIVGQLEPAARVEYSEDALQKLQGQLNELNQTAGQVSGHLQSGTTGVSNGLASLQAQAHSAGQAAAALTPQAGQNWELPDPDRIQAAKNDLTGRLTDMNQTLAGMSAAVQNSADALTADLQDLTNQMNAINQTINHAGENLGWQFSDVSDADTEDDLTAKVENCRNEGEVFADWSSGGIAGAIAPENDWDTVENVEFYGERSLHLYGELRAVLLDCENQAKVYAGKQNAGGIAGWASMGLIRGCVNEGDLNGEFADQVGGIVGRSAAFVRDCSAKCRIAGNTQVGGIAGRGTVATGCRAMVLLKGASEQYGAVFGLQDADTTQGEPLIENFYLPPGQDPGAVDGVSYAGKAEPLSREAFLALEGLPEVFQTVTLTFMDGKETIGICTLPTGGAADPTQFPPVPDHPDGCSGRWEGLDTIDLNEVTFDQVLPAVYDEPESVQVSDAVREDGSPVALVQGEPTNADTVELVASRQAPKDKSGQTWLESWDLNRSGGTEELTIRYLPPAGKRLDRLQVCVWADNAWRIAETTVDGSRLVFSLREEETLFAVIQLPPLWPLYTAAAAAALAILTLAFGVRRRQKIRARQH